MAELETLSGDTTSLPSGIKLPEIEVPVVDDGTVKENLVKTLTKEEAEKQQVEDYVDKNSGSLRIRIGRPNPQANVTPLTKEPIEKDIDKQTSSEEITLDKVMSGEISRINGKFVNPNLIQKAQQGDIPSKIKLARTVDLARTDQTSGVKIAGVSQGQIMPEFKADKELNKYSEGRLIVLNALTRIDPNTNQAIVPDSRVQQLLVDYYSTGQFWTEITRRTAEAGRGITMIPVLTNMLSNFVGAATDAADLPDSMDGFLGLKANDETFSKSWEQRQPAMADFYTKYKSKVETVLPGLTMASSINDDLKEKYIAKHGIEQYEEDFTIVNPVTKKRVDVPMISEEVGSQLLKIGFDELPFSQKALAMILENVGIGSSLAKGTLNKGRKQSKKVKELVDADPVEYANLSPIEVIRKSKINDSQNGFTKGYYQFTQSMGRRLKNRGAIGASLINEDRKNALNLLETQIVTAKNKYNKLDPNDIRGKKLIDIELENLQTQKIKYTFPFARKTFMSSVIVDETVMGLGQAVGYEFAPQLGLSNESGEIMGILATAVQAPQKLTRGVLGYLEGASGGATATWLGMLESLPRIPKGTFIDRRYTNLVDELNRPLEANEKIGIQQVAKILKNLDPKKREMVYTSINEFQELRERIVNSFKTPEKQEEARKLFTLSFAHVSGLAPLIAMERASLGKLKANGKNINEAVDWQLQSEKSNKAATEAIENLKRMMSEDSDIDIDDKEFLTTWTGNFTKAANDFEMELNTTKIEYLSQLQSFKDNILKNPDVPLSEDLISELAEMEIKLTSGAAQNLEAQREIYAKTTQEVMKQLKIRGDNIIALKGDPKFVRRLGQYVEDIYDARKDSVYKQGKLLYDQVDSTANFDLTPLVEDMIDRKGSLVEGDLKVFFSPEGKFFQSKSGREARKAFQSMAKRTIENDLNLSADQFDELIAFHSNPKLLDNPDLAGDYIADATPIDLLIHYGKKSKDSGGLNTLTPFKGTVFELDTIKRHFMAQGRKLQKADNKSEATEFIEYGNKIETVLKTNPNVYEKLVGARKGYQLLNFDPTRKESIGEAIVNARQGPERVVAVEDGYKYQYKKGFLPENFHENIGKNMDKILNGDVGAINLLETDMEELVRFWSAGDMPDGSLVFDITTQAGKDKLEVLSTLITANLYEHWGSARIAMLNRIKRQKDYGQSITSTEYDFQTADNIKNLQESLTIKVNTPDGIQKVNLVDVGAIVAQEKELITLMKLDKRAATQYKNLADELNNTSSLLRTTADAKLKIEGKGIKNLEKIADITDSEQFYDMYIHGKPPSMMAGLRDQYVNARLSGLDVGDAETAVTSRAVLEDEFNKGVMYHMTEGLLKRAGRQRSQMTLLGFDDRPFELSTFTNAGQFASDLSNANTQAVMKEVGFNSKHIQYLEDMSRFFEYAQGASLARYDMVGVVRGIQPNELISRAFNLARGMVSPTYVAGEMGARLAISRRQELVALAAKSEEAARIITMMLKNPKLVMEKDVKTLGTLLEEFVVTDLARTGASAPQFLDSDELYKSNMHYNGKPLFNKVLQENNQ